MSTYLLFPTAIGTCGLIWGPHGIVAVQLPESNDSSTLARLLRKEGGNATRDGQPPPAVQRAIEDIVALLAGEHRDLRHAPLDMRAVPEFFRSVYEVVRRIPPGKTLSYGEVAARCGDAAAARSVGQAMARNPFPIIVPCHRVLAAHGQTGGFSARGGTTTKLRLLAIEGVTLGIEGGTLAIEGASGNLSLPW
jgi:methylated-DNA-[protein]-cysteine S-methyltransferase